MKNIGNKTKIGMLYTMGARMAGVWLQLIHTVFLARLLTPEDFGMVATGMMVIGFATKFGEFGFKMGLIQRNEDITDAHINTLFTMDLLFKVVLWLAVLLGMHSIAHFFDGVDYDGLVQVLPVISFYMVLECFSTTPMAVMQREMNFKDRSIILVSERVFETILAIVLAFYGLGYWSLIYSKLIGIAIVGFWAAKMMNWVPKLQWDKAAAKELFDFGALVFLRNLFRYGSDNAAYFMVLKFIGGGALGIYERAFNLMRLPQKRITKGLNSVLFSTFSRVQDDPERVKRAFRKVVLAVSLVSYPIMAGMAVIAPYLVPVLLGDQWIAMVEPMQIMCAAGILYSIDPFLNSVLTATGFVKFTMYRRFIEFILIAVAAYFGVQYGLSGVAWATLVVSFLIMIVMLLIITRKTNIGWGDYLSPMMPALITSAIMCVAMIGADQLLKYSGNLPDAIMLLVGSIVGISVYSLLHFLIKFKLVQELLQELGGDSRKGILKIKKKIQKVKKTFSFFSEKKTAI